MDVSIGGSWASPSSAEAFISGAWRTIQYGEAYISGTWRTIVNFSPPTPPPPTGGTGGGGGGGSLSLTLSTATISKAGRSATLTTDSVTVTPSGGLAPYTYAWSVLTADAATSLTAPTFATTAATCTVPSSEVTYNTTIQVVVTDSLGVTATAGPVTASFTQRDRPELGGSL